MPRPHQPFEVVPDRHGVVTSFELRELHLGIVFEFGLLCCITCDDLLHEYPRPKELIAPYQCLPVIPATSCTLCESNGTYYFGTSDEAFRRHFRILHKKHRSQREEFGRRCTVQTFCSGYSDNRHAFEVNSSLLPTHDPEQAFVTTDAEAEDIMRVFLRDFKPAQRPVSSGDSLKDTQPFLYFTRWAAHVTPYKPDFLIPLAAYPEDGDFYRELADAAVELFKEEQSLLDGRSEVIRTKLMREDKETIRKPLKRLDPTTVEEYGRTFARWCIFVLRLFKMHKDGDRRYPVTFTDKQKAACEYALQYCERDRERRRSRYLILRLTHDFWAPASMSDISHLELDQFDDPTTRFAIILNLYEDGTFATPSNAAHRLSVVKYFIRYALLLWGIDRQKELSEGGNTVTLGSVLEHVFPYLNRDCHTPFAYVSFASSHATRYAGTSTSFPKVNWTGPDTVSINGQDISFTRYRQAIFDLLERTERKILDQLLRRFSPESLGFDITEETGIIDRFGETGQGYSFLADENNPFLNIRFNLLSAFLHRANKYLVLGTYKDQNGELHISWNDKEAEEWLNCYDECIKELSLLITAAGGQPARGVETCLMKLFNLIGRVRSAYCYKPGILVFVLMYSKTTSMTGQDRLVAHAVPWRIGRLFLIVVSLARPLAGILVERFRGPEARVVQETSVFPLRGVEMTSKILSNLIKDFFGRYLGVNMGILDFRHFVIALQRKKMAEAFAPIQRTIAVVDAQAGHSSETAMDHYALDPAEMHMFTSATVFKHVACSLRWCQILFPVDILTAHEKASTAGAPDAVADESGLVARSTGCAAISEETLTRSFVQAVESSKLVEQLKEQFTQSLTGILATRSAQSIHSGISPAGAIAVKPRYLAMLRQYTCDSKASWTCSAQARALAHILERSHPLFVVLPTSAGKSLLFGSLPLIESGITVVVFPLRALMSDQIAASERRQEALVRSGRAYGRNITIQAWARNVQEDGLYAIATETAQTSPFKSWLNERIYARKLNRIVIDEAHMIVTTAGYRDVMRELGYLSTKQIPIVCLTGTLPPRHEQALCQALGGPTFKIIREPTQRPNIAYHIAAFGSQAQAESALISHVKRYEIELLTGEGILVMCRSWNDVERLAQHLDALKYSRQIATEEADMNLAFWLNGTRKTIVGTTALGTGIHHGSCRAVLHFGPPYGLVDYVQESGRAGRDRKAALSIVFHWDATINPPSNDLNCWAAMQDLIDNVDCIRWCMSREIDGEDLATTCSGGHEFQPCGRCIQALDKADERDGLWLAGPDQPDMGYKRKYLSNEWVVPHLPTYPLGHEMDVDSLPNQDPISAFVSAFSQEPRPPATGEAGPSRWRGALDLHDNDVDMATDHIVEVGNQVSIARPSAPSQPVPVGPTIIADAYIARERERQARIQAAEPEALPMGSHSPNFDLATIIAVKRALKGRCPYCIVHELHPQRHTIGECTASPCNDWRMEGVTFKNQTWREAGIGRKLMPSNASVCFKCLWPFKERHGHPVARKGESSCDGMDDMIKMICWFTLIRPQGKESIEKYFGLGKETQDGRAFFEWLWSVHKRDSLGGYEGCIFNFHRVKDVIFALEYEDMYSKRIPSRRVQDTPPSTSEFQAVEVEIYYLDGRKFDHRRTPLCRPADICSPAYIALMDTSDKRILGCGGQDTLPPTREEWVVN
ncbi:ATP-dependent DNA helicase tlh1 [Ceratobasidium theobromae]|uniref:DNA 3'-5' helicase n=1 Tax=Ceratobasidium theobromae TaxID=1582974 RepID=A0A5N5QAQ2_9AGAM|nr:ATP-dependent DNA helicase tlh1 [Ceratobasidium theobromae]